MVPAQTRRRAIKQTGDPSSAHCLYPHPRKTTPAGSSCPEKVRKALSPSHEVPAKGRLEEETLREETMQEFGFPKADGWSGRKSSVCRVPGHGWSATTHRGLCPALGALSSPGSPFSLYRPGARALSGSPPASSAPRLSHRTALPSPTSTRGPPLGSRPRRGPHPAPAPRALTGR